MNTSSSSIRVRNTRAEDFPGIIAMTHEVYSSSVPWSPTQLASHLNVFPEGQVETDSQRVVGMAASLIV